MELFLDCSPARRPQCDNAIKWSEDYAREQLGTNMFFGVRKKAQKIDKIIEALTDYESVRTHERQIRHDEAKKIGLKVILLEDDDKLQDIVLTIHHCFMHTLSNTPAFKIIENHNGAAFVKQQIQVAIPG